MVIFGKKKEEESYVEVDESKLANQKGINIKIEELNGFTDTDRIQNIVREGNVVFLSIKNLRQKDINELKRSVDKLKKTIIANEGDIVGVDEDFLILTPKFVKVFR
jgi:SepF-like predicted cell division protein (DUF552 family)